MYCTNGISDNWLAFKSKFEICLLLRLYGGPRGSEKRSFGLQKDVRNDLLQSVNQKEKSLFTGRCSFKHTSEFWALNSKMQTS